MTTSAYGTGHLTGDRPFPAAARKELGNAQLRANLHRATHTIRDKRARVVAELPDWEALRDAGSAVKATVMANLPELLERFEHAATAAGAQVHWARDATEATAAVADLVRAAGADEVVKVKSMATQEIALNEALEALGIKAIETDLAELIVQLAGDTPSHILVPAIHYNRTEIRDIFRSRMPGAPAGLTDDPPALAEAARTYLRSKFLSAAVAVSGALSPLRCRERATTSSRTGRARSCLPTARYDPASVDMNSSVFGCIGPPLFAELGRARGRARIRATRAGCRRPPKSGPIPTSPLNGP